MSLFRTRSVSAALLGLLMSGAVGCGPDFKLILTNIPSDADTLYFLTRTDILNSSGQVVQSKVSKPKSESIRSLSASQRELYSYGLTLDGAPAAASDQNRQSIVSVAATQNSTVLRIGESAPVVMTTQFLDLQISFDSLASPPRPMLGTKNLNKDMFMTEARRFLTLDGQLNGILRLEIIGWNFPTDVQAKLSIPNYPAAGQSIELTNCKTTYDSPSTLTVEWPTPKPAVVNTGMPMQMPMPTPLPSYVIDLINNPTQTALGISLSNTDGSRADDWTQGGQRSM